MQVLFDKSNQGGRFFSTIENQSLSLDEIKEMTSNQIVEVARQTKELDEEQQKMLIEVIEQIEKENTL